MRKVIHLFVFFLSITIQAQEGSSYKFVTLPTKFDFMKESNQYNLNELSKFLTNKKEVIAFFDTEEKSMDFNLADPCDILKLNITKENAFLVIKLKITLTDCTGKVVAEGLGSSREKDFKVAYNYALRGAFDNLSIPQKTTNETPVAEKTSPTDDSLIAQKTQTGYKLIDNQQTEKYTLYKTSRNDMFIVTNSKGNGVLYKNGTTWTLEYFDNPTSETLTTTLKIRF